MTIPTQDELNCARDYRRIRNDFIDPCARSLLDSLESDEAGLRNAIALTLGLGLLLDYIEKIKPGKKHELVGSLDKHLGLPDSFHGIYRYRLAHAMANAIKHVEATRDTAIVSIYGVVRFDCLAYADRSVYFTSTNGRFRFDFARVVLRPIAEALLATPIDSDQEAIDSLRNPEAYLTSDHYQDCDDPIDSMIDACNPRCLDCGEFGDDCRCEEYEYDGQPGVANPDHSSFDFDTTMSKISGAYRDRERD